MLAEFITAEIFAIFLIFCRVGTALMVMPIFNSTNIPMQVRLIFAIILSIAAMPYVNNTPSLSGQPIEVLIYIFSEIVVGFLIGSLARIIASAIHIAGMIIAMQSAMAQAVLFDPNQSSQGAIFGNFMQLMAVVLMFSFNLHHLMIHGIVDSYQVFKIGDPIPYADFADSAAAAVAKSFMIGTQLAAPLIIVGLLVNLASGLLARLMPAFQVYFVIMPAQIMISIFIFMATLSATMMWYLEYMQSTLAEFME